ncbi:acyl-CoA thioesterase [Leucobacter chironomi]|uniref:acyl-CoA thioesterase n=1 Tax=Leucobacter chironomi TaxID=491918 RepID=UPI000422DC90|nr:acyl-CoA thioesterase II [Leucobacter chironomi]
MTAFPDLLAMLSVLDSGARTREDILTGPAFPTPHGRSFGGQVLGQAIAAAGTTVADDRLLHSMHGYFLRPGESEERMTFEVARLHDGRSFSTRRVQAYQDGEVLMSMISSFQEDDPGLEHQQPVSLDGLPEPESLPSVWEKYGHLSGSGRASWILGRPFDFRYLESDVVLDVAERVNRQRVWMRSRDSFDAPQLLQCAALAFASDYLLLEPIARQHGIPWATPGMRAASLDHAMWFHRPFRVDEWLLYELDSPTSQGGRGLTHGRFYDRDGRLVASVSQESMIRLPDAG